LIQVEIFLREGTIEKVQVAGSVVRVLEGKIRF
jgi:hypothetical protein